MPSLPVPLAAFAAGLLSFLSPCVLPLVPGYVSIITGNSVSEARDAGARLSRSVLLNSLLFIAGFSLVFILLGAAASSLGQLLHHYFTLLMRISGVLVIILGLHLTGVFHIRALFADKRFHNVSGGKSRWGAFAVGFAFAFGWTPCIGPMLAAILALAASSSTITRGVTLLVIYAAGLAVPFLLTSLALERFLAFYTRFRRHLHTVEVASGVLLVAIGVLILTRQFTVLSGYLSFLNRFAL